MRGTNQSISSRIKWGSALTFVALSLALSGCSMGSVGYDKSNDTGSHYSTDDPSPTDTTQPTGTPSSTPTPTPSPSDGGSGTVSDGGNVDIAGSTSFTNNFAQILTNRKLTTQQWRAAVIPLLYDEDMKQLYAEQDAYKIPFCSAVSKVDIGAASTVTYTMVVSFANSDSKLDINIVQTGTDANGKSEYAVSQIDTEMKDSGGC